MGLRLGTFELRDALGQRLYFILRGLLGGQGSISRRLGLDARAPRFDTFSLGLLN